MASQPQVGLSFQEYATAADPSRALVLLHAFPLDSRMWTDAAEAIAAEQPAFRVLAVDLPGARHVNLTEPPSLVASADRVAATLASLGVTEAVIAGVSMGGYVALAVAEHHPELLRGLILLDTKAEADSADARTNREAVAKRVEEAGSVETMTAMVTSGLLGASTLAGDSNVAARVASWILEQSSDYVAWSQRAMAARPDRSDVLRRLGRPVLVVVGKEDVLAPPEGAAAMATLASGELAAIDFAGHLSPVEAPEAVASRILGFLERISQIA